MPSDATVPGEITSLLLQWQEGDREALARLAAFAYDTLRAIAAGYLRRESSCLTLQATALVNELYLRLARQRSPQLADREHFFTFAAMMMRRILADYARRSHALKRSGGGSVRVPLHEDLAWIDAAGEDMLALDQALGELEALDRRTVRTVELRFFLGCTVEETANLLRVSHATVERDLEFAKAWLYRRLTRPQSVPSAASDPAPAETRR
jgi:RNA polymerase sigma factor (TIGR02999 family)